MALREPTDDGREDDGGAASFDVFLSHNSRDKPTVRELARALAARGLKVWLDEEQLVPGRRWHKALESIIQTVRTAAVLVGKDGLGPWEDPEMYSCLSQCVKRDLPVIPVLLPDAPAEPALPLFLHDFTWVDLRGGLTEAALQKLEWGITGSQPKPRGADDQVDPDAAALAALLSPRALQLLTNPGTAELRRLGGFPQNAGKLRGLRPRDRFQPLIVDLYEATDRCLLAWRAAGSVPPRDFRADCLALLGELLKGGVERDGRTPAELAEIAAAAPDRMFVACRLTGTAATVYCALRDIPLRLAARKPGDRDLGGGSVIELAGLAQGVGPDAHRDALAAAWLAVKRTQVPPDVGSDDFVEILQDAIEMEGTHFHGDPLFLVADGPRDWLHGEGLASAAERLRIGLVIHGAASDYAYLACTERRLINLVCKYLQLLDTA